MDRDITSNNNEIIYQLSLNSASLGLVSPSLFIERLKEEILNKLPNIETVIIYNTKGRGQALVQLKCFSSKKLHDYQLNNLEQDIGFIATALHDELTSRIEEAKQSVA